jgi:hypothetical protein
MKLPNCQNALIPGEEITRYLLCARAQTARFVTAYPLRRDDDEGA